MGAKIQSMACNLRRSGSGSGHAVKSVGAGDCKPGLPSGDEKRPPYGKRTPCFAGFENQGAFFIKRSFPGGGNFGDFWLKSMGI